MIINRLLAIQGLFPREIAILTITVHTHTHTFGSTIDALPFPHRSLESIRPESTPNGFLTTTIVGNNVEHRIQGYFRHRFEAARPIDVVEAPEILRGHHVAQLLRADTAVIFANRLQTTIF